MQNNMLGWCKKREIESGINVKFERLLQVNLPLAKRLGLEHELEGHTGCVNCLEWSESGEILASGSDDFNIIVWDMHRRKPKTIIQSGHEGNIFAVKFLPYSNNSMIASAAADTSIRLHSTTTSECTQYFNCHLRRVKRLSVSKQSPFLLWSGSEDGTVREFDLRQPHSCSSNKPCANVIINPAGHIGPASEVKCIQLHPLYPEYIAVGCSDPYVRLYDRRMLTLTDVSKPKNSELQPPPGCVKYFAPGHLPPRPGRQKPHKHRHYVTTYASFSPDGKELLQNLGGEHIYIYNIKEQQQPLIFSNCSNSHDCNGKSNTNGYCQSIEKNGYSKNGYSNGVTSTYAKRKCEENKGEKQGTELPGKALQLKLLGNDAFSQHNYFQAVVCYNNALKLVPDSSVLYANRAAALLKRAWDGDIYAALRDCRIAVIYDPTHSKAYYRQARCLFELKWYKEANVCLQLFKQKFPDQADGCSIKKLESEICQQTKHSDGDDDSEGSSDGETPRHRRRLPHKASNDEERSRRENACDYETRFVGACNTTTDIKEANFFGNNAQFIIAGSDCGCMLLWERASTNLIEAWQGDESIVNCLQPHPSTCLIATSGIDPVVRLWSPRSSEEKIIDTRAKEVEGLVRSNQKRMNTDPLEEMLRTMGYRPNTDLASDDDEDDHPSAAMQCRTN